MKKVGALAVACLSVLGLSSPGSALPRASADAYFAASSIRVTGGKNSITVHGLGVTRWLDPDKGGLKTSAAYYKFECERVKKRMFRCYFDPSTFVKLRIQEFEFDPSLESAHLSASSRKGKVDVTWTGRGDRAAYPSEGVHEDYYPPWGGQLYAHAGVSIDRDARLSGKVFGRTFSKSSSGLYEGIWSATASCLNPTVKCITRLPNI